MILPAELVQMMIRLVTVLSKVNEAEDNAKSRKWAEVQRPNAEQTNVTPEPPRAEREKPSDVINYSNLTRSIQTNKQTNNHTVSSGNCNSISLLPTTMSRQLSSRIYNNLLY